jgi:phosphoribosylformylglycinamidine synthase
VSFYNQHPEGAVYPTPTIGMVGLLEDTKLKMTLDFKQPGDLIFLAGRSRNDIHSSAYLYALHQIEFSPAPYFDLEEESLLQSKLLACIHNRLVESAHDVAEGGLFVALAESGFPRLLGFSVTAQDKSFRRDAYWFGESQSRIVVTVRKEKMSEFKTAMQGIPLEELGTVTSSTMQVDGEHWGNIREWKREYETAIEKEMELIVEA